MTFATYTKPSVGMVETHATLITCAETCHPIAVKHLVSLLDLGKTILFARPIRSSGQSFKQEMEPQLGFGGSEIPNGMGIVMLGAQLRVSCPSTKMTNF